MSYELEELHWTEVKETPYELAVLTWGATEAHNHHLPYGTDNYQVKYIARAACQRVNEKGGKIVLLPNVPFGINTGQMDVKLCLNMMPSTQLAVLKDLVQVLELHKIPKLLILNGHGGNNFKVMIRELSVLHPEVWIGAANWYGSADLTKYFVDAGDHAGELETSAMMHIRPDLVKSLEQAGDGHEKKPIIPEMRTAWFTTQRPWTQVTADTGVGDPTHSTAEKGDGYLTACIANLSSLMLQLCKTNTQDLYA